MLASGVIMDIEKLQEALKHNVGNITFSEAYARTGCLYKRVKTILFLIFFDTQ